MRKKQHSAFALAANLGAAAMHTGITLGYRWPILAAVATRGMGPHDAAELKRMITEKVEATAKGVVQAQTEALRITGKALAGKLELSDAYGAPLAIVSATIMPALRTVKANSRRLAKRRA
jgi:L-amino acid N-acyltransferase YncA